MNSILRASVTTFVILAVAIAIRLDRPEASAEVAATAPFPLPGSLAHDFTLPLLATESPYLSGDSLRLSDFEGQFVYLDVFGSWCIPCRQKYPDMRRIAEEMNEAGAVMLGLLLKDSPEAAADFFADNGGQAYPFLVLDDATASEWGLTGAPMGFLISPEGQIERKCYGCQRGASGVETLPSAVRSGQRERHRALPAGSETP